MENAREERMLGIGLANSEEGGWESWTICNLGCIDGYTMSYAI